MTTNHVRDISKLYFEQVVESAVPGKPAEKLGAVTAIPKDEQDAARERTLAKAKAMREKKGIKEAKKAKPDYLDFDVDGNEQESMKKALRDKTKKPVAEAKKSNDGNLANNYPPYDKVTRGDVIAGALGKDQMGGKKKPKVKVDEKFSNWREDLIEIADKIQKNKSEEPKIVEKQVNNTIKINPNLDLGEAVEELGGTLLEMVEIDEVDFIVETVYNELFDEGYEEDDIEDAIEYALTEATITYGHDTDKPAEKKRGAGHLVKAVGRLARQKLSSKVRGAKKATAGAVARGARKVAKGALGVARKMEGGDKTPSAAHTKTRTASTYRGAGAGQKERVSSGSYTPPTRTKAEKPADPWEGSASTPQKPKAKTKKASAPKAKAPAAAKPKRKRTSKLDDLLASVRSESVVGDRARNAVADQRLDDAQRETQSSVNKLKKGPKAVTRASASIAANKSEKTARGMHSKPKTGAYRVEETQINEMPYQVMGSPDGKKEKKIGKPVKSRKYADARAAELEDTHKKTGGKYRSQYVENVEYIDEKTLTDAEKAKKEEIFKSLKAKRKDFESRYPGRGEEVMHGVATKMAKRVAEQAMEIQPKIEQSSQKDLAQKKVAQQRDRQRQQEVQILQRKLQALRSAPKGLDTDITT